MRKSRLISMAAAASIAATLIAAPMASAATDYFLKMDGVTGESVAGSTQGAIQVDAFEWGAENKNNFASATSGAGAGKATLKEITIQKRVDSTSPVLFQKLGSGAVIGGMELIARKTTATGKQSIYMRYTFQPVFVTSLSNAGSEGDDGLTETLTLSYGAVRLGYTKQDATGVPAGNVFGTWNQVTNTASMQIAGTADTSNTPRFN